MSANRKPSWVARHGSASIFVDGEVQNLLMLADSRAAHDSALKERRFLSGSVGMALVSPDHPVLGIPIELRLGPVCVSDLKRKSESDPLVEPLVHTDNPRLAPST